MVGSESRSKFGCARNRIQIILTQHCKIELNRCNSNVMISIEFI